MLRVCLALCLAVLGAACGAVETEVGVESEPEAPPESPAPPPPAPIDLDALTAKLSTGLDVSAFSGSVDWPEVAAGGYGFAIAKATEGNDLADPSFPANWPAMAQAGLVRGAYHFYVTEDDPDTQADFYISKVTLSPGDLAPVADIERIGANTEPGLAGRFRTFLERLEAHYGIRPIIYTGPNFWNQNLTADFGDYPLWIANYGVPEPQLPKGWNEWALWQYREDASVEGVEKDADLDRGNPSFDLTGLLVPSSVPSSQ